MKVAVLVSGELRTVDQCWPDIESKILSNFTNYDIFYYTTNSDPDLNKLDILKTTGKLKSYLVEDRQDLDEKNYASNKRPEVIVQHLLQQLDALQKCNKLKQKVEKDETFVYDLVIRIRPDLRIKTGFLDLSAIDLTKIYVCDHDQWFGINDRFYLGNSENMDKICNRIVYLDEYVENKGVVHAEIFLDKTVRHYGLETHTMDVKTCLLRKNGECHTDCP